MVAATEEVVCTSCKKNCYTEEVVKLSQKKLYHKRCFKCSTIECTTDLVENGFFTVDGEHYCRHHYHRLHGSGVECRRCQGYVEGEGVSVLEWLYHTRCFSCCYCGVVFQPHTDVCFDGNDVSCGLCRKMNDDDVKISTDVCTPGERTPTASSETLDSSYSKETDEEIDEQESYLPVTSDDNVESDCRLTSDDNLESDHNLEPVVRPDSDAHPDPGIQPEPNSPLPPPTPSRSAGLRCVKCSKGIGENQSLVALGKCWHLYCFTCHVCNKLLADEYIGKDGNPYCENDYHVLFGVLCCGCHGYITGKVLQAGGKHYHPECARCVKCRGLFGEGEEMYLRDEEIWHPRCSDETEDEAEKAKGGEETSVSGSEQNCNDEREIPDQSFTARDDIANWADRSRKYGANDEPSKRQPNEDTPQQGSDTDRKNGSVTRNEPLEVQNKPIQARQSPGTTAETENTTVNEEPPPVPPPPVRGSSRNSMRLKLKKFANSTEGDAGKGRGGEGGGEKEERTGTGTEKGHTGRGGGRVTGGEDRVGGREVGGRVKGDEGGSVSQEGDQGGSTPGGGVKKLSKKLSTSVYTPKPFQKNIGERKVSRVDPSMRPKQDSTTRQGFAITNPIPVRKNYEENQVRDCGDFQGDFMNTGESPPSQKGVGFNMLQYRRSLRESQRKMGYK